MKIVEIKEYKNGSAKLTVELNKRDDKTFKKLAQLQNKKCTERFIRSTIKEAIRTMIE